MTTVRGDRLVLRGVVASPDGAGLVRHESEGSMAAPAALGAEVAAGLLAAGAGPLLDAARGVMTRETQPLAGRKVLVTRPIAQAPELVDRLAALGAESIAAPAIRIVPPTDTRPLDDACASADSFAWIVFTSANAIDAFMERLRAVGGSVAALADVRICAIGPATGARIETHGLGVDLAPAEHRGEAVSAALRARAELRGTRVLLPRADIARPALPDALRAAGGRRDGGHRVPHDRRAGLAGAPRHAGCFWGERSTR